MKGLKYRLSDANLQQPTRCSGVFIVNFEQISHLGVSIVNFEHKTSGCEKRDYNENVLLRCLDLISFRQMIKSIKNISS